MAAPPFKHDNFQAVWIATKGILPYAVLFYAIDIFVWGGSSFAMIRNIEISTLFIVGFFVINFLRVRARQKEMATMPQRQVIVVQQPVYMPPPPGYGYQGYGAPPQQLPPGYPGQPYPPQSQQQYQQPYPQQPQPQLPAQAPVTAPWPPPQPTPVTPPAQDEWLPPKQQRKPPEGTG